MTILLIAVGALGFLPLVIVLMKRRTYRRIIGSGEKTSATIVRIVPGMRNRYGIVNEKVHYHFIARDGRAYQGVLTSLPGKYRRSDAMEVYYLPEDPAKNTVKHPGNGIAGMLFVIGIAVFVAWGMFQLYEMINKGK